jgi:hypothetical protein
MARRLIKEGVSFNPERNRAPHRRHPMHLKYSRDIGYLGARGQVQIE